MKNIQVYTILILVAVIALLLIFRTKPDYTHFERQQFYDSISLSKKSAQISDLKHDNKKQGIAIDSLDALIVANDSIHSIEILALQSRSVKELELERQKYIIPGTDSSELLQTVEKFKELDHCREQSQYQISIIKAQNIEIENFEKMILAYENKEQTMLKMLRDRETKIYNIEKEHRKELIKTKIIAGLTVVLLIAGAVFIH